MSGTNGKRPDVVERACLWFAEHSERAWRTICADMPPALVETWAAELALYAGLKKSEFLHEYSERKYGVGVEPWGAPRPLGVTDLPAFPTACLPANVREFVEQVAESRQIAVDVPAVVALGVVAVVAAHRAHVTPGGDWREELNAGYVLALPSGERKSAVLDDVTAPLFELEADERRRMAREIAEGEARRAVLEATAARTRKAFDNGKATEADVIAATVARDTFKVPKPPRLTADDVTPARLLSLLADYDGRLGLIADEGAFVANAMGRFSGDGGVLDPLEGVLKALSNSPVRVDRAKSGRDADVPRPALTAVIVVQPSVLEHIRERPLAAERGFFARFAYSLPASLIGRRAVEGVPGVTPRARREWADTVRAVYALPIRRDEHDLPSSPALALEPDARRLLLDYAATVEAQCAPGAELYPLRAWAMRQAGRVLRIAGALHLAAHGRAALGMPLSVETGGAAVAIGHYFEAHAPAAFGLAMGHELDGLGVYVLRRWLEAGGNPTSAAELHQAVRKIGDAAMLRAVLEHLRDAHGLVRGPLPIQREGVGRKKSPEWELHPRAASFTVNPAFTVKESFRSSLSPCFPEGAGEASADTPRSEYRESSEQREPGSDDDDDTPALPEAGTVFS